MKKTITALLISLTMVSQAKAESYIDYISVGLAVQTLQNVNNPNFDNSVLEKNEGMAIVLNAGKNLYSDIALEFEGSASLTKPQWELGATEADVDFWSLGLYGAYIWKINDLSIKPRIGVVYENMKSTMNSITIIDKADLALSGGIGLSYQFNDNYSIYSNYTKFEDDISNLTFGAEYKF
jgi:outer membrane receptor protein involved in Fe transport